MTEQILERAQALPEGAPLRAKELLHLGTFPTSTPRVMRVERTFWEKATAVHVYCQGGRLAGSRFSRHWYDLCHLDSAGHAASALTMRDVADRVARHKGWFISIPK